MTKTYMSKTKDGEVLTKEAVQIEQSDDTPTKKTITLDSLNVERAVLVTLIASSQAELVELDALITKVDTEASKVALK